MAASLVTNLVKTVGVLIRPCAGAGGKGKNRKRQEEISTYTSTHSIE